MVLNFILIILAFTIQSCIFPMLPFLAVTPNLLLILVVSFGFMNGELHGMIYGFFAGLCLDLFYSGPLGFYILFYIYVGYLNGLCCKYYYEDQITLPLVLCLFNSLGYHIYIYIFRFLIRGRFNFVYYFKELIFPEVIFTVVVTLFVYRFFLFMNRKIEKLEQRRDKKLV